MHCHIHQPVWKIRIPPKIHVFLWLLANNKIMPRDNLQKRHIIKPLDCVFCCELETVHHLFFDCIVAKNIWKTVSSFLGKQIGNNFESVSKFWLSEKNNAPVNLISSAVIWSLWKQRNS